MKRNIITEFAKFRLEKSETTWNVYITSTVENKDDLPESEIRRALNSLKEIPHVEFMKKFNQETRTKNAGNIGEWQIDKSEEIAKLFADSLKIKFEGNTVSVTVDFDVILPSDWDKRDVIGWAEGFSKIMQAYTFNQQDKIISRHRAGKSMNKEDDKKIHKFLTDIIRHEKFNLDQGVF